MHLLNLIYILLVVLIEIEKPRYVIDLVHLGYCSERDNENTELLLYYAS